MFQDLIVLVGAPHPPIMSSPCALSNQDGDQCTSSSSMVILDDSIFHHDCSTTPRSNDSDERENLPYSDIDNDEDLSNNDDDNSEDLSNNDNDYSGHRSRNDNNNSEDLSNNDNSEDLSNSDNDNSEDLSTNYIDKREDLSTHEDSAIFNHDSLSVSGDSPKATGNSSQVDKDPNVSGYSPTSIEDSQRVGDNSSRFNDFQRVNDNSPKVNGDSPEVDKDPLRINMEPKRDNKDSARINEDISRFIDDFTKLGKDLSSVNKDLPGASEDFPKVKENSQGAKDDLPKVSENLLQANGDLSTVHEHSSSVHEDLPRVHEHSPRADEDLPRANENSQRINKIHKDLPRVHEHSPRANEDLPQVSEDFLVFSDDSLRVSVDRSDDKNSGDSPKFTKTSTVDHLTPMQPDTYNNNTIAEFVISPRAQCVADGISFSPSCSNAYGNDQDSREALIEIPVGCSPQNLAEMALNTCAQDTIERQGSTNASTSGPSDNTSVISSPMESCEVLCACEISPDARVATDESTKMPSVVTSNPVHESTHLIMDPGQSDSRSDSDNNLSAEIIRSDDSTFNTSCNMGAFDAPIYPSDVPFGDAGPDEVDLIIQNLFSNLTQDEDCIPDDILDFVLTSTPDIDTKQNEIYQCQDTSFGILPDQNISPENSNTCQDLLQGLAPGVAGSGIDRPIAGYFNNNNHGNNNYQNSMPLSNVIYPTAGVSLQSSSVPLPCVVVSSQNSTVMQSNVTSSTSRNVPSPSANPSVSSFNPSLPYAEESFSFIDQSFRSTDSASPNTDSSSRSVDVSSPVSDASFSNATFPFADTSLSPIDGIFSRT